MTDLRTTYAAQFAEILKAAEANVEEAKAKIVAQNQALEKCNERYNDLKSATDAAQSKLKAEGSRLQKVASDREQKTGTAIQVRAAIDRYTEYADQLPKVRGELANIYEAAADAEAMLNQAKADLAAIRHFA